jgi:hypothetical protein
MRSNQKYHKNLPLKIDKDGNVVSSISRENDIFHASRTHARATNTSIYIYTLFYKYKMSNLSTKFMGTTFSWSSGLYLLTVIISSSIVHAVPLNNNLCELHIKEKSTCNVGISIVCQCSSSTLSLPNTEPANLCSSVDVYGSYLMKNI